ncbi:MAG TPA: alpha/beta fold hydrolase [Pyrinomonadaceae bacterium]|jgi:medium-chain acyl-[acyl-carrier-protein] hydrolase
MLNHAAANQWFVRQRPASPCRLRLFCFPYAGGSHLIFRGWSEGLPPDVEVMAAALPGRAGRIREPSLKSIPALVENLAAAVKPYLDAPFALLGHSMGALIGFELARRLRRDEGVEPARLFVSGCRAPQIPATAEKTYDLPDPELVERLRDLKGTPLEVLEHPELMGLVLPLLRADFEAVETYNYSAGPPLACPISAYGGLRDAEVERERLEAWREQTTAYFTLQMFDGGHFFINEARPALLASLARELARLS